MEAKLNLYRTRILIYFKSCLKKSTRKGFDFKWSASLTDRYQMWSCVFLLTHNRFGWTLVRRSSSPIQSAWEH